MLSVSGGYIDLFKYLIEEAKFDPNFQNKNKYSLIDQCFDSNRLEIFKYLIDVMKIDPNKE